MIEAVPEIVCFACYTAVRNILKPETNSLFCEQQPAQSLVSSTQSVIFFLRAVPMLQWSNMPISAYCRTPEKKCLTNGRKRRIRLSALSAEKIVLFLKFHGT